MKFENYLIFPLKICIIKALGNGLNQLSNLVKTWHIDFIDNVAE